MKSYGEIIAWCCLLAFVLGCGAMLGQCTIGGPAIEAYEPERPIDCPRCPCTSSEIRNREGVPTYCVQENTGVELCLYGSMRNEGIISLLRKIENSHRHLLTLPPRFEHIDETDGCESDTGEQ